MNRFQQLFSRATLFTALMVGVAAAESRADDVIISQFNNSGGLAGWRFDYGGVTNLIAFDATQDGNTNSASGSMKVTLGFDAALNASGNNKGAVTIDLPAPLDGSSFVTLEMDLKIAPGSATDASGNSGYFQMVIRNTGSYAFNSQFGGNVSTNDGWRHIKVTPLAGGVNDIRAITLELYGGAGLTGPVTFYVDNLKFTRPSPSTDIVVSRFDDSASLTRWRFDYGGVTNLIEFDSTQDANTNAASGSMEVTFGFDAATLNPSGNNKGAVTLDLPAPIDASAYLSMEMDLKIAPGSAADGSGNSGYFQMVVRNTGGYSFNSQFGANVSTNSGWRHIRVAPPSGAVNDLRAVTLELYGGSGITGPVTFYVDNLKFTASVAPPPPPTLGMERPVRGLNLIPTSGATQRQNLGTVNGSGLGWVGNANPATYSLSIASYPDASHPGFQTHIFLVGAAPGTQSAPDYSAANVVFLDIQGQANGSARAYFRFKTNEPSGNTFLYSGGTLGSVTNPTPLGTWSMTFSQDTNVVVTAPGGATGNFTLPPAAAALFQDPLTVYVGDQPNAGANVGQTAVLSRVQIKSGNTTVLDDNFLADQEIDVGTWQIAAGDAKGVVLVAADAAFWLNWTTPDAGFGLQTTTNLLDSSSWYDPAWTVPQMGSRKRVLVHSPTANPDPAIAYQPDPTRAYFRLLKPAQ